LLPDPTQDRVDIGDVDTDIASSLSGLLRPHCFLWGACVWGVQPIFACVAWQWPFKLVDLLPPVFVPLPWPSAATLGHQSSQVP
jgi:hypothetical protein